MSSIRGKLVLWLVCGCAVGIAVVIVATYTFARAELRRVFDGELRQIAQAVDLREDWVEAGRVRIAREGVFFAVRAYDRSGRVYFETVLPSMPVEVPKASTQGFTYEETQDGRWRIYTNVSPQGIVQVGQPVEARAAFARELSGHVVIPLLIFLPLLGVLIAWLLRPGLAAINETTRLVSDRDAARLDPLPMQNVPSELLPLVEQINALMARLSTALEAHRRFLADAAHGLRSPIAAIGLQAELAARSRNPETLDSAHDELIRGTQRAARLVQQLLDFARVEPGTTIDTAARPVDLASVVRDVLSAHALQAEERGVDLGADMPAEVPLDGRESELRALIANLVDNALRYSPPQSAVTVAVRRRGAALEIEVTDAGPGIPAAERERVFERFYRVEGDPTRGTGLGLSIAKAIVHRHRGSITLSDANPGATMPGLSILVQLPTGDGAIEPPQRADLSAAPL